jgi:hypothetical protein
MPLIKSLKKSAISKNIATEIRAGKPANQAAAIAYNVKKAYGGPVESRMIDALMAKRKKKLEADEDYNTSPDIGEQSRQQSNQSKSDSKLSPEGTYDQRKEALYADGGPVIDPDKAQSAQDSMRKAFKYSKGGIAYNPDLKEDEGNSFEQGHDESTSYAEGGEVDDYEDKSDVDQPKHDSLPYSKPPKKESSFYEPKKIGNNGRPQIDLNMYANGGMAKIAYGHGKSEFEDGEQSRLHDEDSGIAMAEGGIAYNPNLKENYPDDRDLKHDEESGIAFAEGGSVSAAKHLEPNDTDLEQGHDESSSIAYAEGGSVDAERHLAADDEDTEESKDEASDIAMANGGPIQSGDHNPKSGESEDPKSIKARRRKLMIQSLNE